MRFPHRLPLPQRALAWLLLVLLLPLAQAVAVAHAVSHLGSQDGSDERQALHAAHCQLCLTAATVAGGALPATAPALPLLEVRHAAPQVAVTDAGSLAPARAYDSRAPPAFTH